jgi:predicted transcriptional regulator with HTH domain
MASVAVHLKIGFTRTKRKMGFVLWNTEAYCYISGCHRQVRDGRLDNTKTCFDSLAQLSVGVFMLVSVGLTECMDSWHSLALLLYYA